MRGRGRVVAVDRARHAAPAKARAVGSASRARERRAPRRLVADRVDADDRGPRDRERAPEGGVRGAGGGATPAASASTTTMSHAGLVSARARRARPTRRRGRDEAELARALERADAEPARPRAPGGGLDDPTRNPAAAGHGGHRARAAEDGGARAARAAARARATSSSSGRGGAAARTPRQREAADAVPAPPRRCDRGGPPAGRARRRGGSSPAQARPRVEDERAHAVSTPSSTLTSRLPRAKRRRCGGSLRSSSSRSVGSAAMAAYASSNEAYAASPSAVSPAWRDVRVQPAR